MRDNACFVESNLIERYRRDIIAGPRDCAQRMRRLPFSPFPTRPAPISLVPKNALM